MKEEIRPKVKNLKNGILVATKPLQNLHQVAVSISFRGGSFYDGLENGLQSHFLEHMIMRGNKEHPAPSEEIFDIGFGINASTGPNQIKFEGSFHPNHLEEGLALLASIILKPNLTEKNFEIEKVIIEREIDQYNTDLDVFHIDTITKATTPGLEEINYSDPDVYEVLSNLTLQDIKDAYARYLNGKNCLISLVGAFPDEEAERLVEGYFGKMAEGEVNTYDAGCIDEKLPLLDFIFVPNLPAKLKLTYVGETSDFDFAKFLFLQDYLLSASDSILYKRLREEEGLCYDLGMGVARFKDFYRAYLEFTLEESTFMNALMIVKEEIAKICEKGIEQGELSRILKRREISTYPISDDVDNVSSFYDDFLEMGAIETPYETIQKMKKIKPIELKEFAKKLLNNEKLHVLASGGFSKPMFYDLKSFFKAEFEIENLSENTKMLLKPSVMEKLTKKFK